MVFHVFFCYFLRMKKKKSAKKVKKSKIEKIDFLSIETYAPKDVWFAIRLNNVLLSEVKKQARKEKLAVQKFVRKALMDKLTQKP